MCLKSLTSSFTGDGGDGDKIIEACSGSGFALLTDESGVFTSMNYGQDDYPLSTVCKWKIQVPKDKVRSIKYIAFSSDISCTHGKEYIIYMP